MWCPNATSSAYTHISTDTLVSPHVPPQTTSRASAPTRTSASSWRGDTISDTFLRVFYAFASSQPLAVFLTVFSFLEYLILRYTTQARRALTRKCNAPWWLVPSLEELANRNKRLLSDAVSAAHPAAFPADAAAGSSDPLVLSLLAVPSPVGDASANYGAAATAASPWMAGPDCLFVHGIPVLTRCILLHDGLSRRPACWLIEHLHTLTRPPSCLTRCERGYGMPADLFEYTHTLTHAV